MLSKTIKKSILFFTFVSVLVLFSCGILTSFSPKIFADDDGLISTFTASKNNKVQYGVSYVVYQSKQDSKAKHTSRSCGSAIDELYLKIYDDILGISSWSDDNIDQYTKYSCDDTTTLQPLIIQDCTYVLKNVVSTAKTNYGSDANYKVYVDELSSNITPDLIKDTITELWYADK
ncbi:MAG: hypothetical protein Q8784_01325 [Vigna little leaf phytoplasma]|nr:hypothetical protein [Vigna little leaf phytoplasma]